MDRVHPFRAWINAQKNPPSYATIVERLIRKGIETSPKYVEQIITGFRRPSYDMAVALSKVSGGKVTADEFMAFTPSGGKKASAA